MKKLLSGILAAAMCLALAAPAFAAAQDSGQLKKVITAVKSAVEIPEEFSEFDYSSYQRSGGKDVTWDLNWNDPKGEKGHAFVTADSAGNVLSYGVSDYEVERKQITSLDRDGGKKIADAFLKKLSSSLASTLRLEKVDNQRYNYRYQYRQHASGIPVRGRVVSVTVDKTTQKVTSYKGFAYEKMPFASADGVLSKNDAVKAYLDKIGVKLQYASYFDYDNKKPVIFPVYRALAEENTAIDAMTGKTVDLSSADEMTDEVVEDDAMGGAEDMSNPVTGGSAKLTKEEEEKAALLAGQMTAAKAAAAVRKAFPLLTNDYALTSSSLNQDARNKAIYTWSLSFATKKDGKGVVYSAYASVNAKTGEIYSFYIDPKATKKALTPEKAKEEADKLVAALAPAKSKQTKFSENDYAELLKYAADRPEREYTFRYSRYVNGIEFPSDRITLAYDPRTGQFTSYSLNWTENGTFPGLSKVMSKSDIFSIMSKDMDFGLQYVIEQDGKTRLVYDFLNISSQYYNPFTGKVVNHQNKPVQNQDGTPAYQDIEGNWAQERIEKLADNGFYIYAGDEFNPNSAITQADFLRFLAQYNGFSAKSILSMDENDLYEDMESSGIITKEEKNPKGAVTRQEAAKYAVRAMGYGEVAAHADMFVKAYPDLADKEYRGYVAIAKEFDVITANSDGELKCTQPVTNAYAAYMVYQLLTMDK